MEKVNLNKFGGTIVICHGSVVKLGMDPNTLQSVYCQSVTCHPYHFSLFRDSFSSMGYFEMSVGCFEISV